MTDPRPAKQPWNKSSKVASFKGGRGFADAILIVVSLLLSGVVFALLLSVLWSVISAGAGALSPQFIYQNNRYISTTTSLEYGGVGHAILGTLWLVLLATAAALPLGLAIAVYLTQSQSKLRNLVRSITQALAGLPSVVSGLFVLSIISFLGAQKSGIFGAMALFPLMLPTVARVAEEALRLVPTDLRLAALGLGAPNYRAFFQVILPAAKSGVITALLLGLARVVGETAPLILTIQANNGTNLNPFDGGVATLPTYIYGFISAGYASSITRAWGASLVLLVLVGILFITARLLTSDKKRKKSKGTK
ncbi:MAG: phosphate ABC transporter permease PstA [Micrococcales bacterium]